MPSRSQTCWLSPQCFVTPTKASEVGLALKIVTFLQARFAVRAGGHNPNSGFASVSDYGLLIDLSGLNQLSLSADKKILSVGPGNRWKTVYNYLVPKGVSVIGGRVPEVRTSSLCCNYQRRFNRTDILHLHRLASEDICWEVRPRNSCACQCALHRKEFTGLRLTLDVGGLAHFTPRYGLACDNVANFEVRNTSSSTVAVREQLG